MLQEDPQTSDARAQADKLAQQRAAATSGTDPNSPANQALRDQLAKEADISANGGKASAAINTDKANYVPPPAPGLGAATTFTDALKAKAMAPMPGTAPNVAPLAPTGAAQAAPAPTIAPTTVGGTPGVAAGTVTAGQIAPIERIGAATVAPTAGAQATALGAASVDQTAANQFRQGQSGLVDQLQDAAQGRVPSAAELQLKSGNEDAVATQLATAAMQHGYGSLAANRAAGRNIAGLEQKNNLDTALVRANEQATARGQLGTALEGARGQDINVAATNAANQQQSQVVGAQLGTQVSISNADRQAAAAMKDADLQQAAATGNAAAQNELNQRQAANALAASTTSAQLGLSAAQGNQQVAAQQQQQQAQIAADKAKADATNALSTQLANAGFSQQSILQTSAQDLQRQLADAGYQLTEQQINDLKAKNATDAALTGQGQLLTASAEQNAHDTAVKIAELQGRTATTNSIISGLSGLGATAAGFLSDKREKKDIKRAPDSEVDDFLSALEAWNYRYKDKANGEGDYSGPMAQELERSNMGRGSVTTGPDGKKRVDTARLTMALAGAVSRLAKRDRRAGSR